MTTSADLALRGGVFVAVVCVRSNDFWRQTIALYDADLNEIDIYTVGPQGVVYEPPPATRLTAGPEKIMVLETLAAA